MRKLVIVSTAFVFGVGSVPAQDSQDVDSVRAPYLSTVEGAENLAGIPFAETATLEFATFMNWEVQETGSAADYLVKVYEVDRGAAQEFVDRIINEFESMNTRSAEQHAEFCARDFANARSWAAARLAYDQLNVSGRARLVSNLAAAAPHGLWEKLVVDIQNARKSTTITRTDYQSLVEHVDFRGQHRELCGL